MKIITEMNLKDFEFWGDAKQIFNSLTDEEFDFVERLVETDGEAWEKVEFNNFIQFSLENILKSEGFRNEDD